MNDDGFYTIMEILAGLGAVIVSIFGEWTAAATYLAAIGIFEIADQIEEFSVKSE